jgi:hypothetical protein
MEHVLFEVSGTLQRNLNERPKIDGALAVKIQEAKWARPSN